MRPRLGDLFKTLWRPDREEDPERSLVAQAANILQVGEFQVLQLAYHEWYDQEMPDHISDRLFQAYMLHGQVPHWAHEFASRIVRQDEIGLIDSQDADYHRFDHDYVTHVPRGVQQFTLVCMILVAVFAGSILIGHFASSPAISTTSSVLPPFFDDRDMPTPK